MYVIVNDDQSINKRELSDEEIPDMIDSGFVSAVLRIQNGVIEYADINGNTGCVKWKTPLEIDS